MIVALASSTLATVRQLKSYVPDEVRKKTPYILKRVARIEMSRDVKSWEATPVPGGE
jgi:hypothetical protein